MAFKFKSFCSGSSANSAILWTETSAVLIDFGVKTQCACREVLSEARKISGALKTVLVTHAHKDHINYHSLTVLSEEGFEVCCHPEVSRHVGDDCGYAEIIRPFKRSITIGDLKVRHLEVNHAKDYFTTAFNITTTRRGREYKASFFTDFNRFDDEHIAFAANSDLLCLEANHDPKLFTEDPPWGAWNHLTNNNAAKFLHAVCGASHAQPQVVVLGHLSNRFNKPHLPPKAIAKYFKENSLAIKFKIQVAERSVAGRVITLK